MIPDRDISCFSTIPPFSDREGYELAALAELESEAEDRRRLKHLDGYEVESGYKEWKQRLDEKRIAVFASIAGLDPILKKLALPKGKYIDPKAFVISEITLSEISRAYRWWRDKTIGHIILNIPLGTKMKIAQFIAKSIAKDE